jgi:hypothetical protein
LLGDKIHEALARVGVTPARVTRWVGRPCGCEERRRRLNALGAWAARVLAGKLTGADEYLTRLTAGGE